MLTYKLFTLISVFEHLFQQKTEECACQIKYLNELKNIF